MALTILLVTLAIASAVHLLRQFLSGSLSAAEAPNTLPHHEGEQGDTLKAA